MDQSRFQSVFDKAVHDAGGLPATEEVGDMRWYKIKRALRKATGGILELTSRSATLALPGRQSVKATLGG